MIQTLSNENILLYLKKQLLYNFPDECEIENLDVILKTALEKIKYNFIHISLPYYSKNNQPYFNHLNADHYTVFIYYCSNIAYKRGDIILASKLFYLNKSMHSFHCMYDTELPDIFIVCHGMGTVLGKAEYKNYFVVTQGCTVGANGKWEYPQLSEYLIMYPNSSILGKSLVAKNVISSNNSMVLNENIKPNSLLVGQHPNLQMKEINLSIFLQFFKEL